MATDSRKIADNKLRLNVFLSQGGLGDFICAAPALKFLIETQSHSAFKIWCPDFCAPLLRNLLTPHLREQDKVEYWSNMDPVKENNKIGVHMSYQRPHTSLRTHLVDYAYHIFGDYQPTGAERDCLPLTTDENYERKVLGDYGVLDEKYIVVTTGFTAPVRQWLPKHINETVRWIKAAGLTPVFLGKEQVAPGANGNFAEEIDYSAGKNLINSTNLVQAGVIMKHAAAVIGLDNGLLHLAACTDVPIVMGLTSLYGHHRVPQRHGVRGWGVELVEPDEDLSCRGCQSRFNFVEHDFRYCYFKDYKCLEQLTSTKFIAKLEKCLK